MALFKGRKKGEQKKVWHLNLIDLIFSFHSCLPHTDDMAIFVSKVNVHIGHHSSAGEHTGYLQEQKQDEVFLV